MGTSVLPTPGLRADDPNWRSSGGQTMDQLRNFDGGGNFAAPPVDPRVDALFGDLNPKTKDARANTDKLFADMTPAAKSKLQDVIDQSKAAVGNVAHMVRHPIDTAENLVGGAARDAVDALFTPVVGSPTATTPGHGGMMPSAAERTPVAPGAPGAITPEQQQSASIQTIANTAMGLAPGLGLPARAALNVTAGAATAPAGRRIEGGLTGLMGGELLHGAGELAGKMLGAKAPAVAPEEAPALAAPAGEPAPIPHADAVAPAPAPGPNGPRTGVGGDAVPPMEARAPGVAQPTGAAPDQGPPPLAPAAKAPAPTAEAAPPISSNGAHLFADLDAKRAAEPIGVDPETAPPPLQGTPKNTPAQELLNKATLPLDPTGHAELAQELEQLKASGVDKQYIGFDQQRAAAQDFATQMGLKPEDINQAAIKATSGPEIVGMKNILTRNIQEISDISKQAAQGDLTAEQADAFDARIDALKGQNQNLMAGIIRNSSQLGRDLGFLRTMAANTLDPDVWAIQAQKMAGAMPLGDDVLATIRGLARAAQEACA